MLGLTRSTSQCLCPFIPESIIELRIQSTTITSHYATHLQKAAGSEDFFKWYHNNYQWDTDTLNLVDWDAHLAAIQKLTFTAKRFVTKFNFQWLPTGHQQQPGSTKAMPIMLIPRGRINNKQRPTSTNARTISLLSALSSTSYSSSTRPSILPQPYKALSSMPLRTKFSASHQDFPTTRRMKTPPA